MIRISKPTPAGLGCGAGALALLTVECAFAYSCTKHDCTKGDPPDTAQITLNTASLSTSSVYNLAFVPGEAMEPGHIRLEPPLSKLLPEKPLVLAKLPRFKLA